MIHINTNQPHHANQKFRIKDILGLVERLFLVPRSLQVRGQRSVYEGCQVLQGDNHGQCFAREVLILDILLCVCGKCLPLNFTVVDIPEVV